VGSGREYAGLGILPLQLLLGGPVPDSQFDRDAAGDERAVEYPTNRVLAVLDTPDQATCALDGLVNGGFLESEIDLGHGPEEADRVEAGSGRRGVQDWLIRFFERLGLKNAESELKDHYQQALRDGRTIVAVLTPTEERKDHAAQILRGCGGHFINFFGHLNVERLAR
jgi:hypothetical protein